VTVKIRQIVFIVFALLSVAAVIFFFKRAPQQIVVLVPLITGVISTIFSVYAAIGAGKDKKERPKGQSRKRRAVEKPIHLAPSLKSAFFGGLLGGGAAGLLNGASYYISFRKGVEGFETPGVDSILVVFVYALVTGGVFGASCQFLILISRRAFEKVVFTDLVGGVLGGMITGAVMGLWAVWLFGERKEPPPKPGPMFWGGIVCGIFVVLGALLYEHKERGRTLKRTLPILALVIIFVGAIGVLALSSFDKDYFLSQEVQTALQRGAIFGTFVGGMWGLQLGLTHVLYRVAFKG
jgi:multisubunit Na+/H+ antiporter MnhB subunit